MVRSIISDKHRISPRHLHRELWVFSGSCQWATHHAKKLLKDTHKQIWITTQSISEATLSLPASKARKLLGKESQALVYDTFSGFNIDALGIASGIVRGGGIIILLVPPFSQWPAWDDPENQRLFSKNTLDRPSFFIQRAIEIIREEKNIRLIKEEDKQDTYPPASDVSPQCSTKTRESSQYGAMTPDQHHAVETIIQTFEKNTRSITVLTAHRGRGKSTALGLAAAWLLNTTSKPVNLIVTAPQSASIAPIFLHARSHLQTARVDIASPFDQENRSDKHQHHKYHIKHGRKSLQFIAPDLLLSTQPKADLLLIDEASAIPIPLLKTLLNTYSHIVFSSTVHGYEGTGRGFAIRFKQILEHQRARVHYFHLNTPIRWAENDPPEQLVFDLLGLNSTPASDASASAAYHAGFHYRVITQKELLQQPFLLEQLFGLLVLSHYQTRPSDFRQLLDMPNVSIHALISDTHNILLGVSLILYEGPLPAELHRAIVLGKRRLRGHLLPQTLATQNQTLEALSAKAARIQRIAIHPSLHRKGLGSTLIRHMLETLHSEGIDYAGSSFGATTDLLSFWQKNGFILTGIGSQKDASSACHAATVICGLSPLGVSITRHAHFVFSENLPYQLKEPFKTLETPLCLALLSHTVPTSLSSLHVFDEQTIDAFVEGHRLYDHALASLTRFFWYHLTITKHLNMLTVKEQTLLIMKVAQGRSWNACIKELHLTGKKQANTLLRQCVKELLKHSITTKRQITVTLGN